MRRLATQLKITAVCRADLYLLKRSDLYLGLIHFFIKTNELMPRRQAGVGGGLGQPRSPRGSGSGRVPTRQSPRGGGGNSGGGGGTGPAGPYRPLRVPGGSQLPPLGCAAPGSPAELEPRGTGRGTKPEPPQRHRKVLGRGGG